MKEHLIQANALHIPLANNSVQCCVTSPPYWGLRDYGTAKWEGGDPECDHNPQRPDGGQRADRTLPLGRGGVYRDICAKCGAIRVDNQLGLEQTPEEYVAHMVEVFREVKRVLKDDGVLWLNLGDSYNGSGGAGGDYNKGGLKEGQPRYDGRNVSTLKPKDLVGIPWRVAFALQADGWWLRSDVIWNKTNPMPESVRDRPTKSHEYIFMLTKSARYYYDNEAIMEPLKGSTIERKYGWDGNGKGIYSIGRVRQPGDFGDPDKGRNKRTVWHVATAPYKGAHFATYPPKLIEPCILAGSRKGDIVFDPFNGSGTTGLVARKHGRNYIGTDLSMEYIHQSQERLLHKALKHWMEGKIVEKTDLGPLFEVTT